MSEARRPFRSIKIEIAGLLCFFPFAVWAQPEVFRPAQFGVDNALMRMAVAPDDFDGEAKASALRCQGFVETDGEVTDHYCVSDDIIADARVIGIARDMLQDQAFVPARVDGIDVRVLINFAVMIACSDEECSTLPVSNHAYHLVEFGPDYIAPQPILDTRDWYQGFDEKLGWRRLSTGS